MSFWQLLPHLSGPGQREGGGAGSQGCLALGRGILCPTLVRPWCPAPGRVGRPCWGNARTELCPLPWFFLHRQPHTQTRGARGAWCGARWEQAVSAGVGDCLRCCLLCERRSLVKTCFLGALRFKGHGWENVWKPWSPLEGLLVKRPHDAKLPQSPRGMGEPGSCTWYLTPSAGGAQDCRSRGLGGDAQSPKQQRNRLCPRKTGQLWKKCREALPRSTCRDQLSIFSPEGAK